MAGVRTTRLLIVADSPTYGVLASLDDAHVVHRVLRHPQMSDIAEESFQDALRSTMREHYGSDYSPLANLVPNARSTPETMRRWASAILQLYDKYHDPRRVDGPFCSELVATFFDRLNLALFVDRIPSDQVTPNRLADDTRCLLREVAPNPVLKAMAISDAYPTGKDVVAQFFFPGGKDRDAETINKLKRQRPELEAANAWMNQAEESAERFRQELTTDLQKARERNFMKCAEELQELIARFNSVSKPHVDRWIQRRVRLTLDMLTSLRSETPMTPQQIAADFVTVSQCNRSTARIRTLLALEWVRRMMRAEWETADKARRRQLQRIRRQIVSSGRMGLTKLVAIEKKYNEHFRRQGIENTAIAERMDSMKARGADGSK